MKNTVLYTLIVLLMTTYSTVAQKVPVNSKDISPLLIGEKIPEVILKDNNGKEVNLNNVIASKPTVMIFYRGGWCPYCNNQLSALAEIEEQVYKLGYQIIAISPDDYRNLKTTQTKDKVGYQLFSDENGEFIKKIGIAFETPMMVKGYIALKPHKGKTSDIIPVPTVFVLDKQGVLKFEYINPNYKERLSSEMLLAVLESIKK